MRFSPERIDNAKRFFQRRYISCELCPNECHADRNAGENGKCGLGCASRIYHRTILAGEIPEINPVFGIYFSGCNLRCSFCVADDSNRNLLGQDITPELVAAIKKEIENACAAAIGFIGGEPMANPLTLCSFIGMLKPELPTVLFTNGCFKAETYQHVKSLFDHIIVDCHFGNDRCAAKLADARDYWRTLTASIKELEGHAIIRHLMLPGHVDCCFKPIADWMSRELPGRPLHLLTSYCDFGQSGGSALGGNELDSAREHAKHAGLELRPLAWSKGKDDGGSGDSPVQEVIIEGDGLVAFRYMDRAAVKTAKQIGGIDD